MALAADEPLVGQMGQSIGGAVEEIERGDHEAGARKFAEEVALGPGAWELMPQEQRDIMIGNAETFAGETRDPEGVSIDLDGLHRVTGRVLLTQGDQSPPFFPKIIARVAEAIETAEVRTIPGAGHAPQLTHPAHYVEVVSEFVGG
jgi:pimeloyl-ACP methyl ester carboxylesterase